MAGKITIKAEAKINLAIDVLRKRPDGYHDVEMILQSVALHDIVEIRTDNGHPADTAGFGGIRGIEIACGHPGVPSGKTGAQSSNTAWKAADAILRKARIYSSDGCLLRISITKNIPVAAGLGGGSTDAAAVLKGINALFGLGYDYDSLSAMASSVGADVPFCLAGGTAYAEGIGDRLTFLRTPADGLLMHVVIVRPHFEVSTAMTYARLKADALPPSSRPDTAAVIDAIAASDYENIAAGMKNVLETVTANDYPVIGKIKNRLLEYGAMGSMMSGSGPAVFGIFMDMAVAGKAYDALSFDKDLECILTHTTAGSLTGHYTAAVGQLPH